MLRGLPHLGMPCRVQPCLSTPPGLPFPLSPGIVLFVEETRGRPPGPSSVVVARAMSLLGFLLFVDMYVCTAQPTVNGLCFVRALAELLYACMSKFGE